MFLSISVCLIALFPTRYLVPGIIYERPVLLYCCLPSIVWQIKADAVGAEALAGKGVAPLPFSPFHHATRALMYGSALSLGCFSAGVLVVGYSMGVTNVRTFIRLYPDVTRAGNACVTYIHRPFDKKPRSLVDGSVSFFERGSVLCYVRYSSCRISRFP